MCIRDRLYYSMLITEVLLTREKAEAAIHRRLKLSRLIRTGVCGMGLTAVVALGLTHDGDKQTQGYGELGVVVATAFSVASMVERGIARLDCEETVDKFA